MWSGQARLRKRLPRSDRHRRLDRRMMLIIHEFKVLIVILENTRRTPPQSQLRQRQRLAPELQIGLFPVIQIQMAVAARPDQLTGLKVTLLCKHVHEQGITGDVEGNAQEDIRAALVKLAGQALPGDVELKEGMAGHQRHLLQLADVPGADNDAAGNGVALDLLYSLSDLVDRASFGWEPGPPLLAIDRPKLAFLVRPLVPDRDSMLTQPGHVGVTTEEPQQLIHDGAQMHPLRGDERKSGAQVESHLVS